MIHHFGGCIYHLPVVLKGGTTRYVAYTQKNNESLSLFVVVLPQLGGRQR